VTQASSPLCSTVKRTVGVEAIGTSRLNNLEGGLVATIDEALANLSVGSKYEVQGVWMWVPVKADRHSI
jgi:hypothetical protein